MVLGPAIPADPDDQPVACAICGTVKRQGDMVSIKVLLAIAPAPIGSAECPAISHLGCNDDHAGQAAAACITEHILPMLAQKRAQIAAAQAEQEAAQWRDDGTT